MKKEDISGFIVYLLILGAATIFCLTILRENSAAVGQPLTFWQYWLFVVGSTAGGIILNAILCELAHVAGAKAGRYEVISTNILGLCFYRNDEGKRKVKFAKFDGLTGETKILPKFTEGDKISNPKPYLLFGTLFYAVEIILFVILFVILRGQEDFAWINLGHALLTMGVVGAMILVYNIIPFQLDNKTDGNYLKLISNPKNKVAFNELLRIEHEVELGHTDVEIKTFDVITNFTAELNLNKVYSLLEKRDYESALTLLDGILKEDADVSYKIHLRALAQKIFIKLMTLNEDEAKKYYEENIDLHLMREISKDISMPSIRMYILVSGLLDKSKSETIYALNNVGQAYKRTQKSRRAVEVSLYNEALDKVIKAHPTWQELNDYHIEETK